MLCYNRSYSTIYCHIMGLLSIENDEFCALNLANFIFNLDKRTFGVYYADVAHD